MLLVDVQLPPTLVQWFTDRGYAAQHVNDLGMGTSDDAVIWKYASSLTGDVVIVTKDEDFKFLQSMSAPTVRILWVRLGNCSNKSLLAAFEQTWPEIQSGLANGTRIIEVLP